MSTSISALSEIDHTLCRKIAFYGNSLQRRTFRKSKVFWFLWSEINIPKCQNPDIRDHCHLPYFRIGCLQPVKKVIFDKKNVIHCSNSYYCAQWRIHHSSLRFRYCFWQIILFFCIISVIRFCSLVSFCSLLHNLMLNVEWIQKIHIALSLNIIAWWSRALS